VTPKVSKSKEKEHTFLQLKDRGETATTLDELAVEVRLSSLVAF
jgi:hypothetical protein